MQVDKKKIIIKALAKVTKKLRGKKSQYMLSAEGGISSSVVNNIERGIRDPQLTTMFSLAEALNIDVCEFIKLIKDELPKEFSIIE